MSCKRFFIRQCIARYVCLYAYRVQVITPDDRVASKKCAAIIFEKLDEDNEFLRKIVFSLRLHSTFQGR